MIKQEVIDKIMDAARIEDVVGEFVDLKKRGASLIGLCPFHNEKTPSFNVSVSKGIFKCFGCGVGGDSVRFVMEHEKYSYPEALRFLAQKYHIEVEETELNDEQAKAKDHRESLMIVTNWAGEFFTKQLWETDEGRTVGLNYFLERGYREDIIKKFGLGYAPEAWTALADAAKSKGYREEYLVETGLIVAREDGRQYDRFRARVLFPIHNLTGRILGFGG
ncbi:MAG TPA: CHC2 zinc finger domain-containing protein, partial [Sphingobacteriaceae bacterium]|nr:CHC2 zinc finger domain-containing protein [Sphingobacteriaceae bacterium]